MELYSLKDVNPFKFAAVKEIILFYFSSFVKSKKNEEIICQKIFETTVGKKTRQE